jgi:hypothetical protein
MIKAPVRWRIPMPADRPIAHGTQDEAPINERETSILGHKTRLSDSRHLRGG